MNKFNVINFGVCQSQSTQDLRCYSAELMCLVIVIATAAATAILYKYNI